MTYEKYNFEKILIEYNKMYSHTFILSSQISKAVIHYNIKGNVFFVSYQYGEDIPKKLNLSDFVYEYISTNCSTSHIKDIILQKEEKRLNLHIEIWPSNKIRYAYLQSNYYAPNVGNLGKSCMRLKEMQKALNFYVKNGTKIVVVVDNTNKIHARALLWDNIRSIKLKKPFVYLDRVYAKSETLLFLFYDLAETNNWKRYPSTAVNDMNKNYYKEGIDATGMCYLPYNDTFRYLHLKENLLTSSTTSSMIRYLNYSNSYETLDVHNNSAYYPQLDPNRVPEVISNKYISKKDAIFVKKYNGYVLKKNIANIRGDYYSIFDNHITKSKLDGYILKENAVEEVLTRDLIDKSQAVYVLDYKGFVHKKNVVNINNRVYHIQDNDIICYDNNKVDEWYHISQCFINYNLKEINKKIEIPVYTPKGNKEVVKQSTFFDKDLPNNYMQYLTFIWSYCSQNGPEIKREDGLIPKKHAIIAYDLVYSPMLDKILYQKKYVTEKKGLIKFVTGEFIISSPNNRKYLKKFNNKYYLKQEFKLPSKHQLTLF